MNFQKFCLRYVEDAASTPLKLGAKFGSVSGKIVPYRLDHYALCGEVHFDSVLVPSPRIDIFLRDGDGKRIPVVAGRIIDAPGGSSVAGFHPVVIHLRHINLEREGRFMFDIIVGDNQSEVLQFEFSIS